jgi:hypothetical protein
MNITSTVVSDQSQGTLKILHFGLLTIRTKEVGGMGELTVRRISD